MANITIHNMPSESTTLTTLPLELIQLILSSLPDIQSLKSLILTCRTIHNTFQANEARIVPHVVENHIGRDVLPEAIIALKSTASLDYQCDVKKFIDTHLIRRSEYHALLTLVQAQTLYRLHSYVEKISTVIAQETLAKFTRQDTQVDALRHGPSTAEINRVQRALYRLEMYRVVFSARYKKGSLFYKAINPPWAAGDEHQKDFFAKFSPYENEQLCCVYDFLFKAIRPVLDDSQDNDSWGLFHHYTSARDYTCQLVKVILAQGLAEIWTAMQGDGYRNRRQLLGAAFSRNYRGGFMSLRYDSFNSSSDGFELQDYDKGKLDEDYSPFFDDPDHGPLTIWRWAHHTRDRAEFVHLEPNQCLRDRGYVFWDFARLSHWPRFRKPWCAYFNNRDAEHEFGQT